MDEDEIHYSNFERDGEDAVRNNAALNRYNGKKQSLAVEWLRRKDQARSDATIAEQMRLARSAKNAAWAAAIAAIIAAIAAIIAMAA